MPFSERETSMSMSPSSSSSNEKDKETETEKEADTSTTTTTNTSANAITKMQVGVWTVAVSNDPGTSPLLRSYRSLVSAAQLYFRLSRDLYTEDPYIFGLHMAFALWRCAKPVLVMVVAERVLAAIEKSLLSPDPQVGDVVLVVAVQVLVSCVSAVVTWASENIVLPRLLTAFHSHFQYRLMKARCNMDVATSQSPMARKRVSNMYSGWFCYQSLQRYIWTIPQTLNHVALLLFMARKTDHLILLVLCLVEPLYDVWIEKSLYDKPHVSYIDNPNYKRMKGLVQMTSKAYRAEVKSGNLVARIVSEYERCSRALAKDKLYVEDSAREQYRNQKTISNQIVSYALADTTLVYLAIAVALNPSRFSLATLFSMMTMCTNTSTTFARLMRMMRNSESDTTFLRALYELQEIPNILVDGSVAYPRPDVSSTKGMSLELRDLSFSYPGSQSAKPALQNISLSISAGQIVVIVGANGGGKSTIINMLTRLYDASSARDSVMVDGLPISEYKLESLRRATAVLTQDHSLFPLSLKENIGIGLADSESGKAMVDDASAIQRAAEEGGATHCLDKFEAGMDTVLSHKMLSNPNISNVETDSGDVDEEHPLAQKVAELKKDAEVSGGEKQRIVAARTFMRLQSPDIRLVVVDEPTSALDPEGEMQVFDNLIRARQGKTMVFVTHRFGHLVKRADLVVCIKDGAIVESGSHEKLIGKNGEYAKLYEIQAKAFVGPK